MQSLIVLRMRLFTTKACGKINRGDICVAPTVTGRGQRVSQGAATQKPTSTAECSFPDQWTGWVKTVLPDRLEHIPVRLVLGKKIFPSWNLLTFCDYSSTETSQI